MQFARNVFSPRPGICIGCNGRLGGSCRYLARQARKIIDERGTFFMRTWDPRFTPLLETHDPGEPPREGGLIVAKYGKGTYIYTGLSFFRELPAGVKGAYRIFANLVSVEN